MRSRAVACTIFLGVLLTVSGCSKPSLPFETRLRFRTVLRQEISLFVPSIKNERISYEVWKDNTLPDAHFYLRPIGERFKNLEIHVFNCAGFRVMSRGERDNSGKEFLERHEFDFVPEKVDYWNGDLTRFSSCILAEALKSAGLKRGVFFREPRTQYSEFVFLDLSGTTKTYAINLGCGEDATCENWPEYLRVFQEDKREFEAPRTQYSTMTVEVSSSLGNEKK